MKPNKANTFLKWLLRIVGAGLCVAFACVLLPESTMAWTHQWLGLGEFPAEAITIYLARSTSLLYGVHGVVMLYASATLDRNLSLACLLGWLHVVIGLAMLGIDLTTGMPWYWTAFEGVPIALTGAAIVWLARRAAA